LAKPVLPSFFNGLIARTSVPSLPGTGRHRNPEMQ
jgi:hypothetical protein